MSRGVRGGRKKGYPRRRLLYAEPEDWDEKIAEWMARELEGIQQMTEEHWKVVRYLREYWETYGSCPPIKMLLKETGFSLEKIYQLFPSGPAHGACKVAGAPKPTGCV
jgi:TusE/DsrC/DsvC family sulfur relay protein